MPSLPRSRSSSPALGVLRVIPEAPLPDFDQAADDPLDPVTWITKRGNMHDFVAWAEIVVTAPEGIVPARIGAYRLIGQDDELPVDTGRAPAVELFDTFAELPLVLRAGATFPVPAHAVKLCCPSAEPPLELNGRNLAVGLHKQVHVMPLYLAACFGAESLQHGEYEGPEGELVHILDADKLLVPTGSVE